MGGISGIGTELVMLIVAIAIILGIAYYMNSQGNSGVQQIGKVSQGASEMTNKLLNQIDVTTFQTKQVTLFETIVQDGGVADLGSPDTHIEQVSLSDALNRAKGAKMTILYSTDGKSWVKLETIKLQDGSTFSIPSTYDPTTVIKVLKVLSDGTATVSGKTLKNAQFVIVVGSNNAEFDGSKVSKLNELVGKKVYIIKVTPDLS